MEQEIKSVEQNRTWELVPLPDGHHPEMGVQAQEGELGAVIKHKARLVARGCSGICCSG